MFCAVSGVAPEHPVISTKSGHLYERSVAEKYIESTGKCPVTGEPLEVSDLLPLNARAGVKPRPVAATSIPGMLALFQNEWDALMLESFTLKQQLETVRQELGRALYEHDAACRVIARLIKERDDARSALAAVRAPAVIGAPPSDAAGAVDTEVGAGMSNITPEMQVWNTPTSTLARTLPPPVLSTARTLPPGHVGSDPQKPFQGAKEAAAAARIRRCPRDCVVHVARSARYPRGRPRLPRRPCERGLACKRRD